MNILKFVIQEGKIQPFVDKTRLLLKREHIGLNPIEFSKSNLTTVGTKLIGICSCGCEGCDDYIVDISFDGLIVNWYDWHKNKTFHFEKEQYLKEIRLLKIKTIRHYEHSAEELADELLSGTVAMNDYPFCKVTANAERGIMIATYAYGSDELEYELPCKGIVATNLKDNVTQAIKNFITSSIQKKGFVLTDAFYGSLNNLSETLSYEDPKEKNATAERFRRALLCYDQKAIIVTLYYCMDYLNLLRDHLQLIGVPKDVLKTLKVFDDYCFKHHRGLSGKKFEKDIDTITDPIAVEVISAIRCRLSDPQKKHPVIRVFEKVRQIYSYNQLKEAMAIALNCNTEEERTVALLLIGVETGKIMLNNITKEGFNDDITQTLSLLKECNPLDIERCYVSLKDNKSAKTVLIQKLRNILYLRDKRQWKNLDTYRILIRKLQNDYYSE